MSTPTISSLRFPLIRQRTGLRMGPRYRRVVDTSSLYGAARCVASMLNAAMRSRDEVPLVPRFAPASEIRRQQLHRRVARMSMRLSALWARVFAGQLRDDDPRLTATMAARSALVREICATA